MTAVLLLVGTAPIAYIRTCTLPIDDRQAKGTFLYVAVMVVGALIFVLGIDLVKEALWDTRHRVSRYVSLFLCFLSRLPDHT